MELKDFVKSVLKDIVDAVEDTRRDSSRDMRLAYSGDTRTVEFDVAVTAENTDSINGKAGVNVLHLFEGSGNISNETKNSSVSRIKFGVNIDARTKAEEAQNQATFLSRQIGRPNPGR